jgi:LPS-assembly protein
MAGSTTPRPILRRWARLPKAASAMALALACACLALPRPAAAQDSTFLTFKQQQRPTPAKSSSLTHAPGDAQMLVKADEVDYDYTNHRTAAVGNVQI